MVKDIICLNQSNFISLKQIISFHQRKCFKQIIFLIQPNIFSECTIYIGKISNRLGRQSRGEIFIFITRHQWKK